MTAFVVPYKVRMNRYIALIALICFQDFLKIFYYLVLLGCIGKQAIFDIFYAKGMPYSFGIQSALGEDIKNFQNKRRGK
jgi:cysteinyl-tRNA synthetase